MTTLLQSTNGAIGYVGAPYLIADKLPAAAIQNAAGDYAYPNLATSSRPGPPSRRFRPMGRWRSSTRPSPLPPPTRISTFSYVVVSATAAAPRKAALRDWIAFAIGGGQKFGEGLDFAPVPSPVAAADHRRAVRTFASQ